MGFAHTYQRPRWTLGGQGGEPFPCPSRGACLTWCRSRAGLRPSILTRSRLRRAAASGRSLDGTSAGECSPRPRWAAAPFPRLPAAERLSRPSSLLRPDRHSGPVERAGWPRSGRAGRDLPGAGRVAFPGLHLAPLGTAHTFPRCRPNGVSPSDRVPDPARRRRRASPVCSFPRAVRRLGKSLAFLAPQAPRFHCVADTEGETVEANIGAGIA